jgi:hypothetical protein
MHLVAKREGLMLSLGADAMLVTASNNGKGAEMTQGESEMIGTKVCVLACWHRRPR